MPSGFWKKVSRAAVKAGKNALKEFLFQGSNVPARKKVEVAFESAGYDAMKEAFDESEEAQKLFAKLSLDFPDSDVEVPAFIEDLSDEQSEELAAFFAPDDE